VKITQRRDRSRSQSREPNARRELFAVTIQASGWNCSIQGDPAIPE